jgi:hypothetical protein
MKLTPPKQVTFWASVVIGLLGITGKLIPSLPLLSENAFWLVLFGFVLLILAVTTTGL